MKQDLQQQITQLLANQSVVALSQRVIQLVGFFDQIGSEGLVGLCCIPFAAGSQVPHQGERIVE